MSTLKCHSVRKTSATFNIRVALSSKISSRASRCRILVLAVVIAGEVRPAYREVLSGHKISNKIICRDVDIRPHAISDVL